MILSLALGLAALVAGAELLVKGAVKIAAAARVPPLVIGLTIVAFGTSAPELAVSVSAALSGRADVALGNVLGSNIFNVLFILGLSAAVAPLAVVLPVIRRDVWVMLTASCAALAVAYDGVVDQREGFAFVATIVMLTVALIRMGRKENALLPPSEAAAFAPPPRGLMSLLKAGGAILAGLALLVWGSQALVGAAVALARAAGISELAISLTLVAAGTSLPEAATSVVAAVRGQRDIAVGNVVGSNVFNIFAVLGGAAALSAQGVTVSPAALEFDMPVTIATALICVPILASGQIVDRLEGLLLLASYCAYGFCLFLRGPAPLPPWPAIAILALLLLAAALAGRCAGATTGSRKGWRAGARRW